MATQPSEHGNSNHGEPPNEKKYDVHVSVGSAPSQSRGAPEISENVVDGHCHRPLLQAEFRGDWESAKRIFEQDSASNITLTLYFPTKKKDDIEDDAESTGSSSSKGASEISEKVKDGHYYRPLLQAAFRSDWESAKRFFERDSASKTAKITSRCETVLHIAALSAQDQFVEKLVDLLSPDPKALEMVDCEGRTALHNAVLSGRIRLVMALVNRNPTLTQLADNKKRVPLGISAREASMHKEISWFLAKNTTVNGPSHPFRSETAIYSILDLNLAGHYDITLYLVGRYPYLITVEGGKKKKLSIMRMLARTKSHFRSGTSLNVWEEMIYKCIPVDLIYKSTDENSSNMQTSTDTALQHLTKSLWNAAKIVVPTIKRIHEVKLRNKAAFELAKIVCVAISHKKNTEIDEFLERSEALAQATSRGISELVKLCVQFYPELIWISPRGRELMKIAVEHRQERTLGLFLKKVGSTNESSLIATPTREESIAMMLAAAKYDPNLDVVTKVSGSAFQMQRELQWFEAVESWITPDVRLYKYKGKSSWWQIFVKEHKGLLENGEKWVKDTANSCMLVSTLIATILFAAAFTVPGGNDDETGVPLLLGQDSVLVFAISDALGLFFSVIAILLFLAILTSRYEPQDFLKSLPKKIIWGLSCLFLSLAFMLVAFAATLTIVLDKRLEWVFIPITLLPSLPVALFAVLQLPLLFKMVKSTYGPTIFRPEGIWEQGITIGQDPMMDESDSRV